jgi:hypothetical protein
MGFAPTLLGQAGLPKGAKCTLSKTSLVFIRGVSSTCSFTLQPCPRTFTPIPNIVFFPPANGNLRPATGDTRFTWTATSQQTWARPCGRQAPPPFRPPVLPLKGGGSCRPHGLAHAAASCCHRTQTHLNAPQQAFNLWEELVQKGEKYGLMFGSPNQYRRLEEQPRPSPTPILVAHIFFSLVSLGGRDAFQL